MLLHLTYPEIRALRMAGLDNLVGHDAYLTRSRRGEWPVPADAALLKRAIEMLTRGTPYHGQISRPYLSLRLKLWEALRQVSEAA